MVARLNGDDVARRRRERRIKLLFVAVIVLFLLHYWFDARYGRTVPNLFMPEFTGTGIDADGRIVTRTADIRVTFDDGDTASLSPSRLFDNLPSSRFPRIMRLHFRPRPQRTEALGRSGVSRFVIDNVIRHVMPGWMLTITRKGSWTAPDERTRTWLRNRLASLYRDRRVVQADVIWYEDTYVLRDSGMLRSREKTVTLEIRL